MSTTKLYTPRMLGLSADLAHYPLCDELTHCAEARSRTCGSTIEIGFALDASGAVADIGMQVSACAVGQSSAAILARHVAGKLPVEIDATRTAIMAWLEGEAPLPDWPEFDALAPARDHPGRHGALLLPWNAASEALSSPASNG
ncbi:MAG: iron-sulfur cluster assembly scaffold protein [Pseudomonadota bacterium]